MTPYYDVKKHQQRKNERRRRRIAHALKSLGGRCVWCGATEGRLDLDHADCHSRKVEPSQFGSISEARYLAEIPKLQVLCVHCHSWKTNFEKRIEFDWQFDWLSGVETPRQYQEWRDRRNGFVDEDEEDVF